MRARKFSTPDFGVTTRRNSSRSPHRLEADGRRESLSILQTRIPVNDWLVEYHEVIRVKEHLELFVL
jgi:hypothetical protein